MDGPTTPLPIVSFPTHQHTDLDEFVFKMKLTSKDEFEILSKRVENLENKISKLETKKKKKTRPAKRS